jgi:hypothetical protein
MLHSFDSKTKQTIAFLPLQILNQKKESFYTSKHWNIDHQMVIFWVP